MIANTVFLGGTCNGSKWRNRMSLLLYERGVSYFNPVVSVWDDSAQAAEIEARKTCGCVLYGITPKMIGVYSIAEATDDSNKRPNDTYVLILEEDGDCKFSGIRQAPW